VSVVCEVRIVRAVRVPNAVPSSGGIVGLAANADGSVVAQSELGGSCFVGDQLVIASRMGITYYDTEIVP
jgi:hypothetical protein